MRSASSMSGMQLFLFMSTALCCLGYRTRADGSSHNSIERSFYPLSRRLPAPMNQFAWHPTNPDLLLTISGSTNRVYLFDKADLLQEPADGDDDDDDTQVAAISTQPVGNMPTTVAWKTTAQNNPIAVVGCAHDSHLHLFEIDADVNPAQLKLVQAVEIQGSAVTNLAASQHATDPFVYYNFLPNFGAGMEQPSLGVIAFGISSSGNQTNANAEWNDLGIVQVLPPNQNDVQDLVSMRATISPNGRMIYNAGSILPMASFQVTDPTDTADTEETDDDVFWTAYTSSDSIDKPTMSLYYCQQDGYVFQNQDGSGPIDPTGKWVVAQNYLLHSGFINKDTVASAYLTPYTENEMEQNCRWTQNPGTSSAECCPYKSVYNDYSRALGAVHTQGMVIVTFTPPDAATPVGFGYRNPWGGDGLYVPRTNDGTALAPQISAVHLTNEASKMARATEFNITIPKDVLDSRSLRRNNDQGYYNAEDDEMWEEQDVGYNNNGEMYESVPTQLQLFASPDDNLWIALGDKLAVAPTYCFLGSSDTGDSQGDGFDVQLDTFQFNIGQQGGSVARFTFDTDQFLLSLANLPEGATYNADTLELAWAPTPDQVGPYTLQGALIDKDNSIASVGCSFSMGITASYPAVTLSHSTERFVVAEDGKRVAVWSLTDPYTGRQLNSNLTVLEFSTDGDLVSSATTFLPDYVVSQVVIGDKMLFVFEQLCATIHLFDPSTLDEIKSFPNPVSMNKYNCDNRDLFLVEDGLLRVCNSYHCQDSNDPLATFDITGDDLVEADSETPYYTSFQTTNMGYQMFIEGILSDGMLYDHIDPSKILLIIDHGPFFVGGQRATTSNNQPGLSYPTDDMLMYERYSTPFDFIHPIQNPGGYQLVEIPGSGVLVQYDPGQQIYSSSDGSRTQNATLTVIDLTGHVVEKNTLYSLRWGQNERQRFYSSNGNTPTVTKDGVLFVANNVQLYRWTWEGDPPAPAESKGFHFVDKQSKFKISKDNEAETLSHSMKGGKEPYDLFLQYPNGYDSTLLKSIISVDDETATLTVNGKKFYEEAVHSLVEFGVKRGIPEIRSASLKTIEPWSKLPDSFAPADGMLPVALPIYLQAIDSKGEKASLEYYVGVDVEYEGLVDLINKAMDDLQKGNSTASEDDGGIDKRDLEIMLLIAMVVLLTIILMLVVVVVCYKLVLQKDNSNPVEKSEVDGLMRSSNGDEGSNSNASDQGDSATADETNDVQNTESEPEIV